MTQDLPSRWVAAGVLLAAACAVPAAPGAEEGWADEQFFERVLPILEDNCFSCHGLGIAKGNVDLEALAADWSSPEGRDTWLAVLKNVGAGLMPPAGKPRPSAEEQQLLHDWIVRGAFALDPERPDPGRVTVRRLNRTEYRNTIRDLLDVDFDTTAEFPPDDTGHGFDTIGEVLTISPLLMEKYIAAAQAIVSRVDEDRVVPDDIPDDAEGRRRLARELLGRFATRAFRRPAPDETVARLVDLAEAIDSEEGRSFEDGIRQAMVAVLASPRFLFREEGVEPGDAGPYPRIDEYALASRLSYFLWSTMPDDELFDLASRGELRENLGAQVDRMIADERADEFIRHFVGQWLQVRDIESVPINAFAVLARERPPDPEAERRRDRFRELRRKDFEDLTEDEKAELAEIRREYERSSRRFRDLELDGSLRRSMRRETEMLFEYVIREDRSLVELIDADYTFLDERLARHYEIEGVEGDRMRRVDLPPDSPRGGVLTQGTVLAVTSNPDRTSPVKRGLFILENILGTPPAPPPPDLPTLEEAVKAFGDRTPTLREAMASHASDPMCHSCHSRMDPLGLALENFNALGRYREAERSGPIDASGALITGETFSTVQELKRVLAIDRRRDFYRCLSEKMLTYALGRGLDYHDVPTVDALVDRLEANEGRASELIEGIIESAPFQRRRRGPDGREVAGAADPDARVGDE